MSTDAEMMTRLELFPNDPLSSWAAKRIRTLEKELAALQPQQSFRPAPTEGSEPFQVVPATPCDHAQYDHRIHGRACPCGAVMWDLGD